jgi:hypothetical protein
LEATLPEQLALPGTEDLNLDRALARTIGRALIASRGIQTTAAALLGISKRVLNYKLTHHGLYGLVNIGLNASIDEPHAQTELVQFLANWQPVRSLTPAFDSLTLDQQTLRAQVRVRSRLEIGLRYGGRRKGGR